MFVVFSSPEQKAQFCSNKGSCPYRKGDSIEKAKIHWRHWMTSRTDSPISTKLGIKHSMVKMKGIQVKSHAFLAKIYWRNSKSFSAEPHSISTKLGIRHRWVNGIQICPNEDPRPFPSRDDNGKAKIYWRQFLFCRTTVQISTKHGRKYCWVKRTQVCTNEATRHFPMGDHKGIVKIHWRNVKAFFSRSNEPGLNKLDTKYSYVKGIQVCSIEAPGLFPRGDNN